VVSRALTQKHPLKAKAATDDPRGVTMHRNSVVPTKDERARRVSAVSFKEPGGVAHLVSRALTQKHPLKAKAATDDPRGVTMRRNSVVSTKDERRVSAVTFKKAKPRRFRAIASQPTMSMSGSKSTVVIPTTLVFE